MTVQNQNQNKRLTMFSLLPVFDDVFGLSLSIFINLYKETDKDAASLLAYIPNPFLVP